MRTFNDLMRDDFIYRVSNDEQGNVHCDTCRITKLVKDQFDVIVNYDVWDGEGNTVSSDFMRVNQKKDWTYAHEANFYLDKVVALKQMEDLRQLLARQVAIRELAESEGVPESVAKIAMKSDDQRRFIDDYKAQKAKKKR